MRGGRVVCDGVVGFRGDGKGNIPLPTPSTTHPPSTNEKTIIDGTTMKGKVRPSTCGSRTKFPLKMPTDGYQETTLSPELKEETYRLVVGKSE